MFMSVSLQGSGLLLAAAGPWSHLPPCDAVARLIMAAGAMVVMLQAFHARHYVRLAAPLAWRTVRQVQND